MGRALTEAEKPFFNDSEMKRDCRKSQYHSDYLGDIVCAATFAPPGVEVDTAVRCRRRPERKLCHGLIRLRLSEEPAELSWWCPVCGDHGVIRNWTGTPGALSHITGTIFVDGSEYCEIELTKKEYELLSEISVLEPGAEKIVQDAVITDKGMLLLGPLESMDILLGYIAFEANYESKVRRQQALNRLFDKIGRSLEGTW